MEKKLSVNLNILEKLGIKRKDIKTFSPLALAFIGDGVYEIVIRTIILGQGNMPPGKLHAYCASIVCAKSQAISIEVILPMLTEEEQEIYRKGKNTNSPTKSKNASLSDYRKATGYEALLGYLYLKGDDERILFLVNEGLNILKSEKNER